MLRVLTAAAVLLLAPASASASDQAAIPYNFLTDQRVLSYLPRVAAYWNASPSCAQVRIVIDQQFVGVDGARAGGCLIFVGDVFLSYQPAQQAQTLAHEWGHLLGYGHVALPNDPAGVMVSFNLPPQFADLVPATVPDHATAAPAAVAAWAKFDAAYVKWARQRRARSSCKAEADSLGRRGARVAARKRCVQRYGKIPREPTTPATPRPVD